MRLVARIRTFRVRSGQVSWWFRLNFVTRSGSLIKIKDGKLAAESRGHALLQSPAPRSRPPRERHKVWSHYSFGRQRPAVRFLVGPTCWGLFAGSIVHPVVLGNGGVWWDEGKAAGGAASPGRRLCCESPFVNSSGAKRITIADRQRADCTFSSRRLGNATAWAGRD